MKATAKTIPVLVILGLALLLSGIAVFSYLFSGLADGTRRTNAERVGHFDSVRAELIQLNRELRTPARKGLKRIDNTWTDPERIEQVGLSERELKELRARLRKLSIPRGIISNRDEIRYLTFSSGTATGGSTEGYLYSEREPKNYYKHQTEPRARPYERGEKITYPDKGSYIVYTRIEDNWYTFEQYDD